MANALLTRRRATMSAAWSPSKLPGIAGWWRADDIALADGAAVVSWADRTSNANTVTQATGANQPIYKTASVGGKPAVRFARASSQTLAKATPTGLPNASSGVLTVIVVANLLNNQTNTQLTVLAAYAKNAGFAGWSLGYSSFGTSDGLLFSTSGVKNYVSTVWGTSATAGPSALLYTYDASTKAVDFGNNMRAGTDHVTGTTAANAGPDTLMFGNSPATSANGYVDADIAEVIIISSALSTADKYKLADYVWFRYGIATGTPYNASSSLTTPAYDGSGTCVEASLAYDAAGTFTGSAKYLFGFVPYHNNLAANENPSILTSNDGISLAVPSGVTNPIVAYPGGGNAGNNADPFVLDNRARDGKIYLYYMRENTTPVSNGGTFYKSSSDNGATWSAETNMIANTTGSGNTTEGQVVYDSGTYYHLSFDYQTGASLMTMNRRTAISPTGPWSAPTACTYSVPGGRGLWHWGTILPYNGAWYTGASDSDTNRNLWIIKSADKGLTWSASSRPTIVRSGQWDSSYLYRGNLLPNADGVSMDLWYTAANGAADGQHLGHVLVPITVLP